MGRLRPRQGMIRRIGSGCLDQRLEPAKAKTQMILSAAFAALAQIFTPPFRRVLWKTLGLTLLLLVLVFVAAESALAHFLVLPYHWLSTSLTLLAALALLIGFAFAIT